MATNEIVDQYATGLTRRNIERALRGAGLDLDRLRPGDLRVLEDFHAMGRLATSQLADLAGITGQTHVLDAGSGIGGTARYVADRYGCPVAAVDLTGEYCDTARWLNRLVGLDRRITVEHADVTALPFADGVFQVVMSQHVQMNIADKVGLYREARRVLADGGVLGIWDITRGELGEPDFPLPWADDASASFLVTPEELRTTVESSGFAIEQWNDLTEQAGTLLQKVRTRTPSPLGLHNFVPDFTRKAANLAAALADGRLRAVQGLARAIG